MEDFPIPPGGDEDRGWRMISIYWAMFAIELVVMSLRVYARIKIRAIGLDDWIMGLAVLLILTSVIVGKLLVSAGGCRHVYYLLLDGGVNRLSRIRKLSFIVQPFTTMAIAAGRISVAMLILRIVGLSSTWRRYFLYFSIVSTFVISSLVSILLTVMCSPPKAFWTFEPAKCWNFKVGSDLNIFSSSWNVVMDISLAFLPITLLWNLNMAVKKRAGICFLMSLGIFAGICGAIKTSKLPETDQRDHTWVTYDLFVWNGAETLLIVVCGCIPTLKPVYQQVFQRGGTSAGVVFSGGPGPTYAAKRFSSKIPISDDYAVMLTDINKSSMDVGGVRQPIVYTDMIQPLNDNRTASNINNSSYGSRAYSLDVAAGNDIDIHDVV